MKTLKKALAVVMCVVIVLCSTPFSSLIGVNLSGLFNFKAEAASYPTISALKIPRIKQISGDSACYLCSFTSVEAYHRGSYGGTNFKYGTDYSQSEQLYKDIKAANGGKVGWSSTIHNKYGYTKDNSPTLAEIYKQLSYGKPVIVYGTSSTYGTHASVIIGYNGSISSLEKSGFTVMEINASYWKNSQSLFDSYANNPQTYSTSGGNCYITLSSWLSKASRSMDFICYRTATPSYILNYNYNGASGGSFSFDSTTYTITSTIPVRSGYTFLGWSLSSTATTASYVAGDKITLSADTTLYAVWRPNTLTVRFNANGGKVSSGKHKIVSNIIYYIDSTECYETWTYNNSRANGLTNAKTFGLTKEGYTFVGWGTSSSGGTIFDQNNTALLPTDITSNIENSDCEITLYAIWRPNNLKVYYHANGGATHSDWYKTVSGVLYKQADSTKYTQIWTYNSKQTNGLTNAVTLGLYRVGYTFVGWSTTSSGETIFDQDDVSVVPTNITAAINNSDSEITLYAVWRRNILKVNFNANGGCVSPDSFIVSSNIICNKSDSSKYVQIWNYDKVKENGLVNPSTFGLNRVGYTFEGWATDSAGKTLFSAHDNTLVASDFTSNIENGDCEITLYAIWQKNNVTTYTLSYNANGGNGEPVSQSGTTSYKISNIQPTRSGYTFLGWSTNSNSTTVNYVGGNSITLSGNTTLYAVWQKNAVAPPVDVELPGIKIKQTSTTTINYGETLVLTLNETEGSESYVIEWFVDGTGVATNVSEDCKECRVTSIGKGAVKITAKLTDENGEAITDADGEEIFDEITLTSKAGFFQKLISFFKNLFGLNRIIY